MPQKQRRPQQADEHRGLPSDLYAVGVAPIRTLPALLAELGCDPAGVFARAGVDIHLFERPDSRISVDDLGQLLQSCVASTGCQHFGLLVGQRFDSSLLGEIGALMRNSPTVGRACRELTLGNCLCRSSPWRQANRNVKNTSCGGCSRYQQLRLYLDFLARRILRVARH